MVVTPLSFSASMMRLKPSVSSCSTPVALASDISLPSSRLFYVYLPGIARASLDVHVALDVVAQAQRVLAHQPLGALGVPRLQRRHDLLVVDDGAPCPVLLEDGALPDGAHVEEQAVGDVHDQRVLAEPDDGLVELDVGLGILAHLAGDLVLRELVDERVQARELAGRRLLGGEPRRHALQCRPHCDHVEDLGLGLAHDENAAARHDLDQPFLVQLGERLAQRRAADAEALRQVALVETQLRVIGVDVHVEDGRLERVVGARLEAQTLADGSDLEMRIRHQTPRWAGLPLTARGFWYTIRQDLGSKKCVAPCAFAPASRASPLSRMQHCRLARVASALLAYCTDRTIGTSYTRCAQDGRSTAAGLVPILLARGNERQG